MLFIDTLIDLKQTVRIFIVFFNASETRLLPYGLLSGDVEVTERSESTGETVSHLIEIPSGIPLLKYSKDEGRLCKSLYVSWLLFRAFKTTFFFKY